MSHLGTRILYDLLNRDPEIVARARVRPVGRSRGRAAAARPAAGHRSRAGRRCASFDVVGFCLQYELTYTNVLRNLELGGIPLRAARSRRADPLVRRRRADRDASRADGPVHRRAAGRRGRGGAARAPAHRRTHASRGRAARRVLAALARLRRRLRARRCYAHGLEPRTGLQVVAARRRRQRRRRARARDAGVGASDLDDYPFPTRFPVPARRGDLRPRGGRDHPRLHRGLPLLPGRDHLPPGARARARGDRQGACSRGSTTPATPTPASPRCRPPTSRASIR